MSDFYSELRTKRERLLADAIGLGFHMWKAKEDRPAPLPYPFIPFLAKGFVEETSRRYLSEIVERIYWRREPPRRNRACRVPKISFAELYGDAPPKQRNIELREIAERLGLTDRHVRRMLTRLLRAHQIPGAWFKGGQWHPPVDEAVQVITFAIKKRHTPHTKPPVDACTSYVVGCRKKADDLAHDLAEIQMNCETCEDWYRLRRTAPKATASILEKVRHKENELRRAYNFIATLARERRWGFCRLFTAVYEALRNNSKTPVRDANAALAINHAAFYRSFTKKEIGDALLLAQNALKNSDWLDGPCQAHSGDDEMTSIFSDWRNKVSDADLWFDPHS